MKQIARLLWRRKPIRLSRYERSRIELHPRDSSRGNGQDLKRERTVSRSLEDALEKSKNEAAKAAKSSHNFELGEP